MKGSKKFGIGFAVLMIVAILVGVGIQGAWDLGTPETTQATTANEVSPDSESEARAENTADEIQDPSAEDFPQSREPASAGENTTPNNAGPRDNQNDSRDSDSQGKAGNP